MHLLRFSLLALILLGGFGLLVAGQDLIEPAKSGRPTLGFVPLADARTKGEPAPLTLCIYAEGDLPPIPESLPAPDAPAPPGRVPISFMVIPFQKNARVGPPLNAYEIPVICPTLLIPYPIA